MVPSALVGDATADAAPAYLPSASGDAAPPALPCVLSAAESGGSGGEPGGLVAASICSLIFGFRSLGSSFSTAAPTFPCACKVSVMPSGY